MTSILLVTAEENNLFVDGENKTLFFGADEKVLVLSQDAGLTLEQQVVRTLVLQSSGPPGPPGADGTGGDKTHLHTQALPSATWIVVHGLAKFPSVTVIDSSGTTVIGTVTHDSINQCTLTFSGAFSGKASFN